MWTRKQNIVLEHVDGSHVLPHGEVELSLGDINLFSAPIACHGSENLS